MEKRASRLNGPSLLKQKNRLWITHPEPVFLARDASKRSRVFRLQAAAALSAFTASSAPPTISRSVGSTFSASAGA